MITTESGEISEIIDRCWEGMGKRGKKNEVFVLALAKIAPAIATYPALVQYVVRQGISSKVDGYFRRKSSDGLPLVPVINDEGVHAQLNLLSVEEHSYVIGAYVRRGAANYGQAFKQAVLCRDQHGVWIEPSSVVEQVAS